LCLVLRDEHSSKRLLFLCVRNWIASDKVVYHTNNDHKSVGAHMSMMSNEHKRPKVSKYELISSIEENTRWVVAARAGAQNCRPPEPSYPSWHETGKVKDT
jgi:hypothetical protein